MSLRTCENFFSYQASQAITHGAFSTFTYVEANDTAGMAAAMDQPLYDCCSVPVDFTNSSFGNTTSPCAYCGGMCPGSSDVCYTTGGGPNQAGGGGSGANATGAAIDVVTLQAFYGAQWGTIIGVYAAIGVLTAAYQLWQCARRSRADGIAYATVGAAKASDDGVGQAVSGDGDGDATSDDDDPMDDEWAVAAASRLRGSYSGAHVAGGSGSGGGSVGEREPVFSMPFVSPGAGRQYTAIAVPLATGDAAVSGDPAVHVAT